MKDFGKFILFTDVGLGLPIAKHLLDEGNTVIVGMVNDLKDAERKRPETPESYKSRWSQYDGIVEKIDAHKLLKKMASFPDKEEWFVFFDLNNLWRFADEVKKMGFKNGLFPTKLDTKLEDDRDFAKSFVTSSYPDLRVAEVNEFKSIDDGIEFIESSDEFWALKSNSGDATTVVPGSKDIEFARSSLVSALKNEQPDYESQGYILERQIRDGVEFCPQMIWYNGKRVAASVCFEDKNMGSRGTGDKKNCAIEIVQRIELDSPIIDIAFPPVTDKLARKHPGFFVLDANLIMKDGEYFFLEFCANRLGYDCSYTEMEMSGGTTEYFNAIARGECPYKKRFGASVRGFSVHTDKNGRVKEGIEFMHKDIDEHLWYWGLKKEGSTLMTTMGSFGDTIESSDLFCVTESSDDPIYAVHKTYEILEKISFDSVFYRPPHDFFDYEFDNAPMIRVEKMKDLLAPLEE